jgi:TldD protein
MNARDVFESIDLKKFSCDYVDVRIEETFTSSLSYKNGESLGYIPSETAGAFLRVYHNGRWVNRYTTNFATIDESISELLDTAKRAAGKSEDYFTKVPTGREDLLRFSERHPKLVEAKQKFAVCESYLPIFASFPQIKSHSISYKDSYHWKSFVSSRGRRFQYDFAQYGLVASGEFREGENFFSDYKMLWGQSLPELAGKQEELKKFLTESQAHITAPTIAPGKYPVILDQEVVGVFTHESFGHKSEADFMLGDEAAKNEWQIGKKVGAECLTIVDDGTNPRDSGYCPIDDEGYPAQKVYLIKNGILQGRLHSLATAKYFAEEPTGNARAMNFEFEPIVRMRSTYIEAGKHSRDELFAKVKDGLYVSGVKHGSGLSTFTIAPLRAYRIKDGKLAEPVKVSVLSGSVFETLNKISAVSTDAEIHSSAFGGCGKGEQSPLPVSDGGPLVLVDEMQVG